MTEKLEGVNALFDTETTLQQVPLTMILVKKQIRELFENDDNTIAELAESIKKQGVLQPILLREIEEGYELVAGERRFRAAQTAGLITIPALVRKLSDEEAEDAQLAENIQRQNLTQMEVAKKIQADFDRLGSVEAVLEKHQKSASWLSKMLSLLNLPPETKRLMSENISADMEVIGGVRAIEKINPAKAKKLVDELKKTKNKQGARKQVEAAKKEVKPSKKQEATQQKGVATPRENENIDLTLDTEGEKLIANIYQQIIDGKIAGKVLTSLKAADKLKADEYLRGYYKLGKGNQDAAKNVLGGFGDGVFEIGTFRELHLAAFVYGLNGEDFVLVNALNSVQR